MNIGKILNYTSEGYEFFLTDEKTQDAVIRKLQILAETTQRLSDDIKETEPSIPWQDISGLRNILVHQYTEINIPRIWIIIERDLPNLANFIHKNLVNSGSNTDRCKN